MNRFMKAGPAAAREFLFAKYGKGGGVKDLGANIIDLFEFKEKQRNKQIDEAFEAGRGELPANLLDASSVDRAQQLRDRVKKLSPLQQMSEQDVAQAVKTTNLLPFSPQLTYKTGKPKKPVVDAFLEQALEQWKKEGSGDKLGFIERFMDYEVDFDTLDDLIFEAEKIPAKFRTRADDGDWSEFSNLRMGYYNAIEEGLNKKLK